MLTHSTRIAGFGLALALVLLPAVMVMAEGSGADSATPAPKANVGTVDDGRFAPKGKQPTLINPLGNDVNSVAALFDKLINVLIQVGLVVIVLAFLWAGFKFIFALGDEKAVTEAKNIFLYTVIGTGVLLGAKVIVTVIKGTVAAVSKQ